MFKDWLISDIERAARKSNRVVISDPSCFLTFIVKELTDYAVLTLNSPTEEMNARLQPKIPKASDCDLPQNSHPIFHAALRRQSKETHTHAQFF